MWQVGSISAAQKSVLAYRGSHTEEDSPFHPAVAVSLRAGRDRRCALPHTHQKPLRDSSLAAAAAGRAGLRPLAGSARRAAARTADWLGRGGAGREQAVGRARPGPGPSSAPADCWRFSGINKPFPFHSCPGRPSG